MTRQKEADAKHSESAKLQRARDTLDARCFELRPWTFRGPSVALREITNDPEDHAPRRNLQTSISRGYREVGPLVLS